MHTYMHVLTHAHTRTHIHVHTHVHTRTHMHVHTHAHTYTHAHTHTCSHTHTYPIYKNGIILCYPVACFTHSAVYRRPQVYSRLQTCLPLSEHVEKFSKILLPSFRECGKVFQNVDVVMYSSRHFVRQLINSTYKEMKCLLLQISQLALICLIILLWMDTQGFSLFHCELEKMLYQTFLPLYSCVLVAVFLQVQFLQKSILDIILTFIIGYVQVTLQIPFLIENEKMQNYLFYQSCY